MRNERVIRLGLIENARDSLCVAVHRLSFYEVGSTQSSLKQAILAVSHAIELLLKERLHRVLPALVWENVDKYPNPDARTVTVGTAMDRLKSIGRVELSSDDEETVKALYRTRNNIEHHVWESTEKQARQIVCRALAFAFIFSTQELGQDLVNDFKKDDTWDQLLYEQPNFVDAYGPRLSRYLEAKAKLLNSCNACGQDTVLVVDESCALCGWKWDASAVAT